MKTNFVLVIVAHLAYTSSALECYQCDSHEEHADCGPTVDDKFNKACEEPFDSCVLGIFEYQKSKEIQFVRQCGESKESEALCNGKGGIKVWGCHICKEDKCNSESSGKYLSSANEIKPIISSIFYCIALTRSICNYPQI